MILFRAILPLALLSLLVACQPETVPPTADAASTPAVQTPHTELEIPEDSALDRFEWPSLQALTVTGEPYDLEDHRGHWVVVNFWATWCAPCRKEMPELSELHARRGDINVVGLAYEEIEAGELHAFLAELPVTYPVVIVDVDNPPPDFATPRGLPTTYLIGPDGKVARQFLGPVSAEQIEGLVAGQMDETQIQVDTAQ